MDGLTNITKRIEADAKREAAQILSGAEEKARQIREEYEAKGLREAEVILKKAEQNARERQERLYSLVQLDARKLTLTAKQEAVNSAFEQAQCALTCLDEDTYVVLLAALAASASRTGKESLILSPRDKDQVGQRVVDQANRLLKKESVTLPKPASHDWLVPMLEQLIARVAEKSLDEAALTLDGETRKMSGGLVLRDEDVETNCSFEVMLRLAMDTMAAEVAQCLFG